MLESVLDSAREAACIISAEGRLDLMSPLTREWLTQGVHLRVRRNALQHADQSAHQRFLATVGAVPGDGTPRWTVLPGKWGETYRIRIARAPHTVGMSVGPRAILRIERRDIFSVPDETILRETFGLTLAEGRVFRQLIAGHDAAECAVVLAVAIGTVRKQIASVLNKTGCNRQSELVRLSALL